MSTTSLRETRPPEEYALGLDDFQWFRGQLELNEEGVTRLMWSYYMRGEEYPAGWSDRMGVALD